MEVNLSSVNLTVKSVELIVEKLSTRALFYKAVIQAAESNH